MWRYLTVILASLLLLSCATRKVAVSKIKEDVRVDSVVVEKNNSVAVQQNAISIKEVIDEIEIVPIDTAKPLVIDGKEYFNATIRFRKTDRKLVDSTKIVVTETAQKSVEVKREEKKDSVDRKVEKKSSTFFWLWILLIVAAAIAVIRYVLK